MKKLFHGIFLIFLGAVIWIFASKFIPTKITNQIDSVSSKIIRLLYFSNLPPLYSVSECPDFPKAVESLRVAFGDEADEYLDQYTPAVPGRDDLEGIIKWRMHEGEPYSGYTILGNIEFYSKTITIKKESENIDKKRGVAQEFLKRGFTIYEPMNIPLYRYPGGVSARKVGFEKDGYMYLLGMFDVEKEEYAVMKDIPLEKVTENPSVVRLFCAKKDPEITDVYTKYYALPHDFTNETVVNYTKMEDGLLQFTLLYPGGVTDFVQHEFFLDKDGSFTKIYESGEKPPCSLFEIIKIGKGSACYRPEKKEFDVVKY